ncbi:MAG: T9SS type A sorting domain-containing protein [Flavobacteriales bacterium]|nr:T9SS type A sorting domain-containing protein [Flavobacteriales bacterium]
MSMYPNPTNGMLNIVSDATGLMNVEVIDLLGAVVRATKFTGRTTMDLTGLAHGVYSVRVSNGDQSKVERITLHRSYLNGEAPWIQDPRGLVVHRFQERRDMASFTWRIGFRRRRTRSALVVGVQQRFPVALHHLRPWWMKRICSPVSITLFMSCVIATVVVLRLGQLLIRSSMTIAVCGSRPLFGSSQNRYCGSSTMARAMPTLLHTTTDLRGE